MVRQRWFVRLRWIILTATLALLFLEQWQMTDARRPAAIVWSVVGLAICNVVWTVVGRWVCAGLETIANGDGMEINDPASCSREHAMWRVVVFGNAQMTVDLLILTVILRFSGGVENPMAVFYLFHTLIAALLLRPTNALLQGAWAIMLYGLLGYGECAGVILPHFPFLATTTHSQLYQDPRYVASSVGVLAAGVLGTLYFTLQISSRLDKQETELGATIGALRSSQQSLRDVQAQRSRFMMTAAHQLKSPLAAVQTLAGLILDGAARPDQQLELVRRIRERCGGGIAQVEELLTLARIEQGAPARHSSAATVVQNAISGFVGRFAERAEEKRIRFVVDTRRCGNACVAVDSRDLEDCVANLVDNALKYTASGGVVEVIAVADGREIRISVRDNGMGIAENQGEGIFEPFRRGRLALEAGIPGTGLGLAIVREVVRQAGGHVSLQSEIGKGTEVELRFPRSQGHVGPSTEKR